MTTTINALLRGGGSLCRSGGGSLCRSGGGLRVASTITGSPFSTTASSAFDATASAASGGDSDATTKQHPSLKEIPSLPFFGTSISAYSGVPSINYTDLNNFFHKQHKDHGPFYTFGIPGIGTGLHGTIHVLRDPQEMLKVIKQEGAYPTGIIEKHWPTKAWIKKSNYSAGALFDHGEEWKRLRSFMQKDLMSPSSAREYLPGILRGAARASKKAPQFVGKDGQLMMFLHNCTVDMFTEILFGGDDHMSPEDYRDFCNAAIDGLSGITACLFSPMENLAHRIGIETAGLRGVVANFERMDEIAQRRFRGFLDRAEKDELTEQEKNSYFFKVMQRQPDSDVTLEEAMDLSLLTMIASVDTTAAKIAWSLLHLALRQDVQDKLYDQLDRAVQKEGGELTASVLERSEVPLLSGLIRESHRCTPALFNDITKVLTVPTKVHGITLPADSTIHFDSLTNHWDPDIVKDPMVFDPERWFKENVEARKNTPAAIVDHPFYSGPFSQGARRCPGSRVAYLEEQALIARLVLDWHIQGPEQPIHWRDVPGKLQTLYVPDFPSEVQLVPRSS